MDAKILLIHDAGQGKGVKCVHEEIKNFLAVFLVALEFEVVELWHDSWFVVASEHDDVLRGGDFHEH